MISKRSVKQSLLTLCVGSLSSAVFALGNPVDYIDVTSGGGININDGKIIVSASNGNYNQVSSGNTVTFHKRMKAGCKGNKSLANTSIYFGTVTTSGGIMEASNNYSVGIPHQHAKSIPYTEAELNVPLNQLGFDPVQVCQNMLQSKLNKGLSKMQVMNSDQVVSQNISFSAVASCGNIGKNNYYYAHDVIGGKLDVICKAGGSGMPDQIQKKEMVIPAVPLGGNNQVQAGYQPLQIFEANILAETLNYSGACPKELKFTVRIKGHGRGGVKYRVKDGIKHIASGSNSTFDEKGGWWQDDFTFTIKAEKINQQVNHNFSLRVEYRDGKAQGLNWEQFNGSSLNWRHSCKPQARFQMGNQQGGGIKYDANNSKPSRMQIQPKETDPQERPNRAL